MNPVRITRRRTPFTTDRHGQLQLNCIQRHSYHIAYHATHNVAHDTAILMHVKLRRNLTCGLIHRLLAMKRDQSRTTNLYDIPLRFHND